MPAYTFYHPGPWAEGDCVELIASEAHHAIHVMRLRNGDRVELLNGCGVCHEGILQCSKRVFVNIGHCLRHQAPPACRLSLVYGMPSLEKCEWVAEKCAELGIDELLFFPAELSGKQRLGPPQMARLNAKVIGACKQSGALYQPTLRWLPSLEELPWVDGERWWLLSPGGLLWQELPMEQGFSYTTIRAFVGPEKGFSGQEVSWLEAKGALAVSIHPHILRTETAALMAMMLLHQSRSLM